MHETDQKWQQTIFTLLQQKRFYIKFQLMGGRVAGWQGGAVGSTVAPQQISPLSPGARRPICVEFAYSPHAQYIKVIIEKCLAKTYKSDLF